MGVYQNSCKRCGLKSKLRLYCQCVCDRKSEEKLHIVYGYPMYLANTFQDRHEYARSYGYHSPTLTPEEMQVLLLRRISAESSNPKPEETAENEV